MRWTPACIVFALLLVCATSTSLAQLSTSDLVLRWAPFIYQDTDAEGIGPDRNELQDYITNIFYDRDVDSDGVLLGNNWENISEAPLNAYVYYSLVESETHFFIGYYFYHPRDWVGAKKASARDIPLPEHEHDLEGVMLVVAKPAESPDDLELMYTQAHRDTYYFFPDDSSGPNVVDVPDQSCIQSRDHRDHLYGTDDLQSCPAEEDASLFVVTDDQAGYDRAAVFIECRGHGLGQVARAMVPDAGGLFDFGGSRFAFRGGDGIFYRPSLVGVPEAPLGLNDEVTYALLPLRGEFWVNRRSSAIFESFVDITTQRGVTISGLGSVMLSDDWPLGGANPPWYWDEHSSCDDSGVCADNDSAIRGDWLLDPAQFIENHVVDYPALQLPGFFQYVDNVYLAGDNEIVVDTPPGWTIGATEDVSWDVHEATSPQTGMSDICIAELVAVDGSLVRLGRPFVMSAESATIIVPPVQPGTYRLRIRTTSDAGSFLPIVGYSSPFDVAPDIGGLLVSNVHAQRRPLTAIWDVTYDLETVYGAAATVSLFLASDADGAHLDLCRSVSGDIGAGVAPGSGRHIVWDAGADFPGFSEASCRLRVTADDSDDLGNFVFVPPGTFTMGSPEDEPARFSDEPQHQVTLSHGLHVQATEVTNQQYRDMAQWAYDRGCVDATSAFLLDALDGSNQVLLDLGSYCEISFSGGRFTVDAGKEHNPVMGVTWYGAAAYCDWLSLYEHLPRAYNHGAWRCNEDNPYATQGYRLPTEAEWEYACRAGTESPFYTGSCLAAGVEANYNGNEPYPGCPVGPYVGGTVAVGGGSANAHGLHDMHGNVWEWCNDWYGAYGGTITDPAGPTDGQYRIARSGGWDNAARSCRSACRNYVTPTDSGYKLGFRPVRSSS